MKQFQVIFTIALCGIAVAEPPITYSYKTPSISISSLGHGGGGSYASGIGDDYSSGYSVGSGIGYDLGGHSGGGYTAVSGGYQTSEGKYVDPILLHKVKEILLDQENLEESRRNSHGGHISLHYGAPSSHYGVPSYSHGIHGYGGGSRVVGIELDNINQAIQVAQYHQSQHVATPSGSYGISHISIPSGSYGVPGIHH